MALPAVIVAGQTGHISHHIEIDKLLNTMWVNVQDPDFGAVGDGSHNDTIALRAGAVALHVAAAGASSGGQNFFPPGTYMVDGPISYGLGLRVVGSGSEATFIKALPSFTGAAIIQNLKTDGTQQDCYVENLTVHGNAVAGTFDGILFDSMFVNTYLKHVKVRYVPGNGVHFKTTANVIFGPAYLNDVECDHNGLDQILIEGHFHNIALRDIDVEHFAAGHHGLHIKGIGHDAAAVFIDGLYSENHGIDNAASIWIESVCTVTARNLCDMGGGVPGTGACLVRITGTNQWSTNAQVGSKGIIVEAVYTLFNFGYVLVDDQTRSHQETGQQSPAVLQRYDTEQANTPIIHRVGGVGDPAFENSWVNQGAGADTVHYFKDTNGVVFLGGQAKNGSSGTATIFTLPAGFRPNGQRRFVISDNAGTAVVLVIGADGTVAKASSPTPGTGFTALDGVSFIATA